VDAARARLLAGKALVGAGEMTAARREFDAALATFELCGAAGLAERARRAMRKMDRGATGRSRRSHAAVGELGDLTARQTEIVRRVVSGHTNRRISEELFLSEKSVEAHLTRLFAKLGVSSRAELAAVAAGLRHRPRLDR
jgi:DNA-binding NarL/FixJ family response regulator